MAKGARRMGRVAKSPDAALLTTARVRYFGPCEIASSAVRVFIFAKKPQTHRHRPPIGALRTRNKRLSESAWYIIIIWFLRKPGDFRTPHGR